MDVLKTVNGFLSVHRDVVKQKIIDIDKKINLESDEENLKVLNKIKSKIIWLKNYHNESMKEAIPELEI